MLTRVLLAFTAILFVILAACYVGATTAALFPTVSISEIQHRSSTLQSAAVGGAASGIGVVVLLACIAHEKRRPGAKFVASCHRGTIPCTSISRLLVSLATIAAVVLAIYCLVVATSQPFWPDAPASRFNPDYTAMARIGCVANVALAAVLLAVMRGAKRA